MAAPHPPTPASVRSAHTPRWSEARLAESRFGSARWAAQQGLSLRVLNNGHHWLFQKPGFVAEWWPSSAKLVLDRDYLHDRHAPHWPQVAALLEQAGCRPSAGGGGRLADSQSHET